MPTADERILPNGTAYVTDVGMTGPYDGVIGVKKELVVGKFLNGMPVRFEPATGDVRLCAVVIDCDEQTGKATRHRAADAELAGAGARTDDFPRSSRMLHLCPLLNPKVLAPMGQSMGSQRQVRIKAMQRAVFTLRSVFWRLFLTLRVNDSAAEIPARYLRQWRARRHQLRAFEGRSE